MIKYLVSSLAGATLLVGAAQAGDYNHKDWPVSKDANGVYAFTAAGKSRAVPLCTAYYTADVMVMDKHQNTTSQYGQLIRAHEEKMRDAYKARYSGGAAKLGELVKDMEWHFGNSAQYGVFQEFKDSANMACEGFAVENGIVTAAYMDGFMNQLMGSY